MTTESETAGEYMIRVNNYVRDLLVGTRDFPVSQKTRYRRLLRKVRKYFGLKINIDLAYQEMNGNQEDNDNHINNRRWITMSNDRDLARVLSQRKRNPNFELKIVPSDNDTSMHPFKRGCKKVEIFMREYGPTILEAILIVRSFYEASNRQPIPCGVS
ncbi:hypothetical protein INT45_005841 [Circinella minor]|uniref:Uncharacterized protein n=1 Tax=Circinella minor TaxID=1195481 RepID=A0A8H7VGX6_9FUNG|nr:hypothetical protein INT45_005841 [Circinella minor]